VEHELLIEAGHTERNYWRDLFPYRELFYFLAWRDVLALGNFWTARS
jgi:lipopolysaccharide transport system permease protein